MLEKGQTAIATNAAASHSSSGVFDRLQTGTPEMLLPHRAGFPSIKPVTSQRPRRSSNAALPMFPAP